MPEAFYERDGDRFASTELTRGPWDPSSQHAGPPAALLGREIERLEDAGGLPGRPDHLRDPARGADRAAAGRGAGSSGRAAGCRWSRPIAQRRRGGADPGDAPGGSAPPRSSCRPSCRAGRAACPAPSRARAGDFFPTGQEVGYHTAMEYRFLRGRLPRARPGDGLDADALSAGRRRGALAAAAGR